MAHTNIDAGYDGAPHISDANGLLVRHDGSFSDLGATPMDLACDVNLAWIEGVVELSRPLRNAEE